jgi:hypothetical protein
MDRACKAPAVIRTTTETHDDDRSRIKEEKPPTFLKLHATESGANFRAIPLWFLRRRSRIGVSGRVFHLGVHRQRAMTDVDGGGVILDYRPPFARRPTLPAVF